MVRVMSIFHFASQTIQQLAIEELSAACLINQEYIALAKNFDHTIEIRRLSSEISDTSLNGSEESNSTIESFSSVDDVQQLYYSSFGNFLISVEGRISNYEKAEIRYVRIYVNWDNLTSSTQSQALRARIAGKITPMKKSLEMIELPLNSNPSIVTFCQSTGNILVGYKNTLQLFYFKYCTNETTKLQYVDFFEAPFTVELDFEPTKVLLTENIVCCCNKQYMHVFKINSRNESSNSTLSESNFCTSTEIPQTKEAVNINLEYNVDFEEICKRKELNGNTFKVDIKSNQEEILGFDESEMKPLIVNELNVSIKHKSNLPESAMVAAQNLLQLKLQSMKINGVMRENVDIFKTLFMRPLYIRPKVSAKCSDFPLNSKFFEHFYGCAILITTQQDAYLYQVNTICQQEDQNQCFLNIYPFTSSVIDVYFNFNMLHALCDNGIESYTHRIGQKLLMDLGGKYGLPEIGTVYKNLSNTISLVNLRPFMNVHYMIPSDSNVVLLANDSPNSPNDTDEGEAINWTIYNLKYPAIETIYQDFKEFADKSLRRYPSFYLNLVEEMHVMIKTHTMLGEFQPEENSESGSEMKLVWHDCEKLLEESSLALGDCFVLNPAEHKQGLIFYEMANLNIIGIFQRFIDQNGIMFSPLGLIEALKTSFYNITLTHDNQKFDEIFSSTINYPTDDNDVKVMKFGEAIIELFSRYAPKEVAKLTLESCGVFREYMDEKIYEFLINYDDKSNEEMLCIILHLLKKDEVSAASSLLDQIKREDLYQLLVRHWNILFEFSTHGNASLTKKLSKSIISFSDFTELLFLTNSSTERCELLTDVLLYHIFDTKMIKFNGNMKLFMEYLASQLGHESYLNGQNILKMLLEKYLWRYYETRTQDGEMSLLSTTSTTVSSVSEDPQKSTKPERKHSFLSWNNDDDMNSSSGSHHKHAMRILIRVYLSQLKSMSLRQEKRTGQDARINKKQLFKVINEMSTNLFMNQKSVTKFDKIAQLLIQHSGTGPILFLDERFRYLDWLPPFESILQLLSNTEAYENQYDYNKIDKDLLLLLIKLQAILCSGEVSSDIVKEILSYLESNRELIGHDSIMICLLPLNQAVDLIIKNNPQCILEYARCHFKFDNDWSNLIKILQKQANEFEVCEANMGQILFYQRLLKETLEFLAATKPLDAVLKIFPDEKHLINNEVFETIDSKLTNDFEDYVKICVDRERSDKIKKMVEQTGMQLYEAISK